MQLCTNFSSSPTHAISPSVHCVQTLAQFFVFHSLIGFHRTSDSNGPTPRLCLTQHTLHMAPAHPPASQTTIVQLLRLQLVLHARKGFARFLHLLPTPRCKNFSFARPFSSAARLPVRPAHCTGCMSRVAIPVPATRLRCWQLASSWSHGQSQALSPSTAPNAYSEPALVLEHVQRPPALSILVNAAISVTSATRLVGREAFMWPDASRSKTVGPWATHKNHHMHCASCPKNTALHPAVLANWGQLRAITTELLVRMRFMCCIP